MPLLAGSRLGPYEILAPLGAGGMGEVYRARDTRLGREVAIKVLPAAIASDPERLKRFEREARSASSLNHPNIVTIYDIGSVDSVSYIAMELVSGQPLRALLGGPLPIRRLLQIGAQVAEGLAKAHAAGIVHRDLKPENVMVTEDGLVKILDFGLAKLTQPDTSGSGTTQAPTVSGATEEGVILGTVGYMSPEQALGKPVDYRSDQFSFGSILYEMATGRRAFQRGSAPQTLTAIIQDEPEPVAGLNPRVPGPLRWIVERCLVKEPRNRYTSTEDLARELTTVRDHLSEATSPAEGLPAAEFALRSRRRLVLAVVAGAIVVALGVATWKIRRAGEVWQNPLQGARFTRLTDWEGSELNAAISRDGKFVVFLSDRDGQFDAWVNQVGSGEFINLTKGKLTELFHEQVGTVGFSDDATRVWLHYNQKDPDGIIRNKGLWLVPTLGGSLQLFLKQGMAAVWSPDGSHIVYFEAVPGDPIFVADRNGGNPRRVYVGQPGVHCHFPIWSGDGRSIYFVRFTRPNDADIWRVSTKGGEPERVTNHRSRVAYPALLDVRTMIYTAAGEDGSSALHVMAIESRVSRRVSFGLEEYVSVAASGDGRRLVASVANPVRDLWTVPISGEIADESRVSRFPLPTARVTAPRYERDGLFYLSASGGANGLWKFKDGIATELWKSGEGSVVSAVAISQDGRRICFPVSRGGHSRLYLAEADGTEARALSESLEVRGTASWSPDGKWIAAVVSGEDSDALLKIPADGSAPVRLAEGVLSNPVWSPDGKLILYTEARQGAMFPVKAITPDKQPVTLPEIIVRPEGNRYRFLPDGGGIVFMTGEFRRQNFWLFDFSTQRLRQLTNLRTRFLMRDFDVSRDGKQIIFDRVKENSDIVLIDLPPR